LLSLGRGVCGTEVCCWQGRAVMESLALSLIWWSGPICGSQLEEQPSAFFALLHLNTYALCRLLACMHGPFPCCKHSAWSSVRVACIVCPCSCRCSCSRPCPLGTSIAQAVAYMRLACCWLAGKGGCTLRWIVQCLLVVVLTT
jgi:hypothetical protein